MSKTFLYLVILAILGFGVWFFLFSEKSGELFRSSDSTFTIRDTGAIGKIFLSANSGGAPVLLERRAEGWIYNNKYPVLESTLKSLLTTLCNQEALHPVTDAEREGIIRNIAGNGVKVEVYDRGGHKMRSFYVGGELNRFTGTAMLMEGSERPYAVQIPGFEGYLTTRYTVDPGFWRDRLIFDLAPENVTQVSVRYPQEPLNSFTLTQQGNVVSVKLDSSLQLGQPLNQERAKSYAGFFNRIFCEAYLLNIPELDSIVRSMPQKAFLDVQGKGGYHKAATLIYYPIDSRSKNAVGTPTSLDEHFNNERYFAVINGGADTVTVQIRNFERILRRGYEFFTPGKDAPEVGPPLPVIPR